MCKDSLNMMDRNSFDFNDRDARIPELIRPLLQDYLGLLAHCVPSLIDACYLHGSVALNAFNERLSDIDFITVVRHNPTSHDLTQLQIVHRTITTKYPRWKLDGSYLRWQDFGCLPNTIAPSPYVAEGIFHQRGYRDLNLVTWWVLKHHGIVLLGLSPQSLAFTVSWDELVTRMHDNLHSYWRSWTRSPTRLPQLLTNYGIQWSVLGILRLWYAFCERDIVSKTEAGRYALTHLPERFHLLIQEAINLRDNPQQRFYKSRIYRAYDAVNFLRYAIQLCDRQVQVNSHET
jgi:Domain of unknown function (DUF4111)